MASDETQLPRGWAETTLAAVCQILDSRRIPVNKSERARRIEGRDEDELYPYYGATGKVGEIDDFIFEGEHVLVGEDGAPFLDSSKSKAYLVRGKFWVNNHAHIIKSSISNAFVCHHLNYIEYSVHVTGTTRLKLTQDALRRLPLRVAPTNEQVRIVAKIEELFSELDKGIESLKTARRQLEVYQQSVLKHAFEGKLTTQWRKENKDKLETPDQLLARIQKERAAHHERQLQEWNSNASRRGKTIKRSAASRSAKLKDVARLSPEETKGLPLLPSGWSYVRLGLLIDEPKYGTSKKCDYNFEGTGVLRIPNVVRGVIDEADLKGACFEDDEKVAYSLRSGDILMIRSNGSISIVGKCALVSSAEQRYLYAGYLIRIRSNPAVVLPTYLAALLSSHLVRVQIEGFAKSTSGVNNINSGEIQSLTVPLCGVQEQQEVVARLSAVLSGMDATVTEIDEQLRTTDALRQTILKKAFAGHLVAQDPSDESASVLLETIRTERTKAGKSSPTARKNRKAKTAA